MRRVSRVAPVLVILVLTGAHCMAGLRDDRPARAPLWLPGRPTLASQANNDFAFDLYRQLTQEGSKENLFFSPYSVSSVLTMTAEGARGLTASEMGRVLRFPKDARETGPNAQLTPWRVSLIHEGITELNNRLTVDSGTPLSISNADWTGCQIANALWGQKTYPFRDEYVDTIAKYYQTGGVFAADFIGNFSAERQRINDWVSNHTNGRIEGIIPRLSPGDAQQLRLILVNAIYFKGEWVRSFKTANTKPRTFTLSSGEEIKTPMMYQKGLKVGRYGAFNADGSLFPTPRNYTPGQSWDLYPDENGFALMALPYKGQSLSMVLIAPNRHDGLPAIEKLLNAETLGAWLRQLAKREVRVALPKFKMETGYSLKNSLGAMGMSRAFGMNADFSGMAPQLYIAMVLHKAYVDVNEKGTEAAAAAAVGMAYLGEPAAEPFVPLFKADRPFVFLIRDNATGAIVFLGRMMDPGP